MKGKVAFVLGAAVGYVLGSRAGRERYEQIRRGSSALWNAPPVQRGVTAVQGYLDDRLADLKDAAGKAGIDMVKRLVSPGENAKSETVTPPPTPGDGVSATGKTAKAGPPDGDADQTPEPVKSAKSKTTAPAARSTTSSAADRAAQLSGEASTRKSSSRKASTSSQRASGSRSARTTGAASKRTGSSAKGDAS